MSKILVVSLRAPIAHRIPRIHHNQILSALSAQEEQCSFLDLDLSNIQFDDYLSFLNHSYKRIEETFKNSNVNIKSLETAIFSFAPIPLLIYLGFVVGDLGKVTVYDFHRHSSSWNWEQDQEKHIFKIERRGNQSASKDVILILSISGKIISERIGIDNHNSLPTYEIYLDDPRPNLIRDYSTLQDLSNLLRTVFHEIKETHGEQATIHLFPAIPLSISVQLGLIYQPNSDPGLSIYNRNSVKFVYSGTIKGSSISIDHNYSLIKEKKDYGHAGIYKHVKNIAFPSVINNLKQNNPNKQEHIPWIFISLLCSLIASFGTSLLFDVHYIFYLLVGAIVFICVLVKNPKNRYLSIFYTLLAIFLTLNAGGHLLRFIFNYNEWTNLKLEYINEPPTAATNVCLILLMALALLLDKIEKS